MRTATRQVRDTNGRRKDDLPVKCQRDVTKDDILAAEQYIDAVGERVRSSESLMAFARKLFSVFHK